MSRLLVLQRAITTAAAISGAQLVHPVLARQLERSSSSVALNIAEGAGRFGKDRLQHYRIAYGSCQEAKGIRGKTLRHSFDTMFPTSADAAQDRASHGPCLVLQQRPGSRSGSHGREKDIAEAKSPAISLSDSSPSRHVRVRLPL